MRNLSLVRIRLIRLTLMALMGVLLVVSGLSWFWIIGLLFLMSTISAVSMLEADKVREEDRVIRSFYYD